MPNCCEVGGFRFPKNSELRKKWQVAIRRDGTNKRLWKPAYHSVVCGKHFKECDFREKNYAGFPLAVKKLKKDAVPSIFSFGLSGSKSESAEKREQRYQQRLELINQLEEPSEPEKAVEEQEEVDFAMEIEIEAEGSSDSEANCPEHHESRLQASVGTQISKPAFGSLSIEQFENDAKAVSYYTGFKDINHFRFFFDCLGPAAYCLNYSSRTLSKEDELFLCLMKLRQNKGKLNIVALAIVLNNVCLFKEDLCNDISN